MRVKGSIRPLRDKIFVTDMEFGVERTKSGILVPGADGKVNGIMPRWGRVWAIGDEQTDIKVGEWVCVEHGRWSRTINLETETGDVIEVRMIDNNAIMLRADEKPSDVYRAEGI